MPKKTAYSRSGAQRNKTKQKSFELVRPVSDENVLETVAEGNEEEEREEDALEMTASPEVENDEGEVAEEEVKEVKTKSRGASAISTPVAATLATSAPVSEGSKSAAARMAARRQAAQKAQRSSSSLISVEHYNYVRKDLIFILILAIIMFSAIIILHFVLGG